MGQYLPAAAALNLVHASEMHAEDRIRVIAGGAMLITRSSRSELHMHRAPQRAAFQVPGLLNVNAYSITDLG